MIKKTNGSLSLVDYLYEIFDSYNEISNKINTNNSHYIFPVSKNLDIDITIAAYDNHVNDTLNNFIYSGYNKFITTVSLSNIPIMMAFPNYASGFIIPNLQLFNKDDIEKYVLDSLNEYHNFFNCFIFGTEPITNIKNQIIREIFKLGFIRTDEKNRISINKLYDDVDKHIGNVLKEIFDDDSKLNIIKDSIYKNMIGKLQYRDSEIFGRGVQFGTNSIHLLENVLSKCGYIYSSKTELWEKDVNIIPNIIFYQKNAYKIENLDKCVNLVKNTLITKISIDVNKSIMKSFSRYTEDDTSLTGLTVFVNGSHPNSSGTTPKANNGSLLCQGELKQLKPYTSTETIETEFPIYLNALEKMLGTINFDSAYKIIDEYEIKDMLKNNSIKKLLKQPSTSLYSSYDETEKLSKLSKEIVDWS